MSTDKALEDAIHQVAKAKVAEALGADVIGQLVQNVMEHKSRAYSGRDEKTTFERIVGEEIERVLQASVRERLEELAPAIKSAISASMAKHVDQMATKIIDGLASDDWRTSLNITIPRERE